VSVKRDYLIRIIHAHASSNRTVIVHIIKKERLSTFFLGLFKGQSLVPSGSVPPYSLVEFPSSPPTQKEDHVTWPRDLLYIVQEWTTCNKFLSEILVFIVHIIKTELGSMWRKKSIFSAWAAVQSGMSFLPWPSTPKEDPVTRPSDPRVPPYSLVWWSITSNPYVKSSPRDQSLNVMKLISYVLVVKLELIKFECAIISKVGTIKPVLKKRNFPQKVGMSYFRAVAQIHYVIS